MSDAQKRQRKSWRDYPATRKAEAAFFSQPKPKRAEMLEQVKRNQEEAARRSEEPQTAQPPAAGHSIPHWTESPERSAAVEAFFNQPKLTRAEMLEQEKRNDELLNEGSCPELTNEQI